MPPKIDEDKCQGAGQCVEVCPADPNCFEMGPDGAKVINPDACLDCGSCEAECPNEAITLE